MATILRVLAMLAFYAAYFIIGFIQFSACYDLFSDAWGLPGLVSGFLSVSLGWFPLVGTVAGIAGAMTVWGWPFLYSVLVLVVLPYAPALVFGLFFLLLEKLDRE